MVCQLGEGGGGVPVRRGRGGVPVRRGGGGVPVRRGRVCVPVMRGRGWCTSEEREGEGMVYQ